MLPVWLFPVRFILFSSDWTRNVSFQSNWTNRANLNIYPLRVHVSSFSCACRRWSSLPNGKMLVHTVEKYLRLYRNQGNSNKYQAINDSWLKCRQLQWQATKPASQCVLATEHEKHTTNANNNNEKKKTRRVDMCATLAAEDKERLRVRLMFQLLWFLC